MNVIYIRVGTLDKQKLEAQAKAKGLTLTAYCRMILLEAVNNV